MHNCLNFGGALEMHSGISQDWLHDASLAHEHALEEEQGGGLNQDIITSTPSKMYARPRRTSTSSSNISGFS